MAFGSISKVGSKFRVCFDYGKDEADKRIRKYKTYDTKREAELQMMARHSVSMEDGTAIVPRVMTLKEWLTYWLENMYAVRSAETSVYAYRNMMENHILPALGNIKLQKLKPMHIQKYYSVLMSEKKLSPNTVIKHHDLLNTVIKAALKQEYLSRNPLEGVERPKKIKHMVKIYNPKQLQKLLIEVKGNRLGTAVNLGAYLGLRREEICGLKWEDIDFDAKILTICRAMTQVGGDIIVKDTKTNASQRKLYIPDGLLAALRDESELQAENKKQFGEGWQGKGFVVVWEDGRSYRPNYISELFTKFLKENNLPKIVLHELRHTFASISNEAGVQEFNIGKAMGHANVGTTKKIYTHLFDDKHMAAIDAVANLINGGKKNEKE